MLPFAASHKPFRRGAAKIVLIVTLMAGAQLALVHVWTADVSAIWTFMAPGSGPPFFVGTAAWIYYMRFARGG